MTKRSHSVIFSEISGSSSSRISAICLPMMGILKVLVNINQVNMMMAFQLECHRFKFLHGWLISQLGNSLFAENCFTKILHAIVSSLKERSDKRENLRNPTVMSFRVCLRKGRGLIRYSPSCPVKDIPSHNIRPHVWTKCQTMVSLKFSFLYLKTQKGVDRIENLKKIKYRLALKFSKYAFCSCRNLPN